MSHIFLYCQFPLSSFHSSTNHICLLRCLLFSLNISTWAIFLHSYKLTLNFIHSKYLLKCCLDLNEIKPIGKTDQSSYALKDNGLWTLSSCLYLSIVLIFIFFIYFIPYKQPRSFTRIHFVSHNGIHSVRTC